jgi:radical SAM superfamily enzyme YgiQ (UPF0313 family)
VDYVIVGEGELPLAELLDALREEREPEGSRPLENAQWNRFFERFRRSAQLRSSLGLLRPRFPPHISTVKASTTSRAAR